jgi:hypothetical protein
MCFTMTAGPSNPGEFADHARLFGPFAIEVTQENLRVLGGLPVTYIPEPTGNDGYEQVGVRLVTLMARISQMFDLKPAAGEPGHVEDHRRQLWEAAQRVVAQFYPVKRRGTGDSTTYFEQREWRIAQPMLREPHCIQLPEELVVQLEKSDPEFWGSESWALRGEPSTPAASGSRAYQSALLRSVPMPGGSDRHPMSFVRRIICPIGLAADVRQAIKPFEIPVEEVDVLGAHAPKGCLSGVLAWLVWGLASA